MFLYLFTYQSSLQSLLRLLPFRLEAMDTTPPYHFFNGSPPNQVTTVVVNHYF